MVANVRPPREPIEVTELSAKAGMSAAIGQPVADHCDAVNGAGVSDINAEGPRPIIDCCYKGDGGIGAEIGPWPESGEAAAARRVLPHDRQLRQTAGIRDQHCFGRGA